MCFCLSLHVYSNSFSSNLFSNFISSNTVLLIPHLTQLSVNGCGLNSKDVQWITETFPSLEVLYLEANEIILSKATSFKNLQFLQTLSLANNLNLYSADGYAVDVFQG